jgi:alkylated DNA nucleotide flippase Atl1
MLGRSISSPVSGLVSGRWMAQCPADLPWWRVIGADGSLKTFGRGPEFGAEQTRRLRSEGIEVEDERVASASELFWEPESPI